MSIRTAQRVAQVKPSATIAMSMKAAELKRQGRDILSLSMGEPDFDTPDHVQQAAIDAIGEGRTRYTPVDGTPELKDAIIEKFRRDNDLRFERDQVLVSCGAKQSLYNLMQAVIDPGDEVLVPAPYWVSYPDMVRLAGGAPVTLQTTLETGFRITPQQLGSAITEQTRLLVLNSPGNPTGRAYRKAELEALGEVLDEHPRVLIVSDDIYEHIWWADEPFATIASTCPGLSDRVVTVNGVSKAYAMTGWRIGYAAADAELIGQMRKIQGQSTSNPCSISQAAAEVALSDSQHCVAEMCKAFKKRHDWLVPALNELPGIRCEPGEGAFYVFADCAEAIDMLGIDDDPAFCEFLLEEAGVALVPGSAFGAPGHARFSFACGMSSLREAVDRIAKALADAG
jgi:aspartate aminotransferase